WSQTEMENSDQEKVSDSATEFKVPAPVNIPYEKPDWSDISKIDYGFEVIKGGLSVEIIDLPSKEFLVLVNKQQISSRNYIRLRVGDQIKFGESTRTYVLLGPEEPQTQQTIKPKLQSKPAPETTSVTWGFAEDAEDESEVLVAVAKESWKRDENAYYYKDPKKALRNWLEEPDQRNGSSTFLSNIKQYLSNNVCTFMLTAICSPFYRDADRQAAIDACEKLDMLGLLRAGQDEAVETYESLIKQREELLVSIEEIRNKIHQVAKSALTDDDLDNYMDVIRNEIKDESTTNLENTLQDLLKQEQRLARLIEITKPLDIMQHDNNSSAIPNLHAINVKVPITNYHKLYSEQELSDIKKNL
ncbi:13081_t:CDS:2, partial [Racocetra fulgida]